MRWGELNLFIQLVTLDNKQHTLSRSPACLLAVLIWKLNIWAAGWFVIKNQNQTQNKRFCSAVYVFIFFSAQFILTHVVVVVVGVDRALSTTKLIMHQQASSSSCQNMNFAEHEPRFHRVELFRPFNRQSWNMETGLGYRNFPHSGYQVLLQEETPQSLDQEKDSSVVQISYCRILCPLFRFTVKPSNSELSNFPAKALFWLQTPLFCLLLSPEQRPSLKNKPGSDLQMTITENRWNFFLVPLLGLKLEPKHFQSTTLRALDADLKCQSSN